MGVKITRHKATKDSWKLFMDKCADCGGVAHEDEGYTNEHGQTICQGCNHENIWFDQNGDSDE